MKRHQYFSVIILLLLLLMLIPAEGFAGKGIKVGINLAKSSGDFIADPEFKLGFIGGAFFAYNFTNLFSIQPEFLYSMKGYRIDSEWLDCLIEVRFEYFEIPIMAKMRVAHNNIGKTHIYAGPSFGYNISAKGKVIWSENYYESNISYVNTYEIGIVFGGSTTFKVWKANIVLDLRVNMGMTSWNAYIDTSKNRTITMMLGYSI